MFYWHDPSWKKARCANCGRNIWNSGGDPDWGLCYECFTEAQRQDGPTYEVVKCDICGKHEVNNK